MQKLKLLLNCLAFTCCLINSQAQLVINEGSNRNYSSIPDENFDYPDWIELYNSGTDTVFLLNYSLTDNSSEPSKWTFPNVYLLPGEFKTVFCSGKDRKPVSGFIQVANTGTFIPSVGWNTHTLSTPFYWDGVSNLLINTCSYNSTGYTDNSIFNQTSTAYTSTVAAYLDGGDGACYSTYGTAYSTRPNMQLNGFTIGSGTIQNAATDYPAPYGNWYWSARHQMLIPASELIASGLSAGYINNLAFDVVSSNPVTVYDYIEVHMKLTTVNDLSTTFDPVDPNNNLHTNFKISTGGETVYLYSPSGTLVSSLTVNCEDLNNSNGLLPDASSTTTLFASATPTATNNSSGAASGYLDQPLFSVGSGFYATPFTVSIVNPNGGSSSVHYTLDGSEPTLTSPTYTGTPVNIFFSCVLKAKAFASGILPSQNTVTTYLFGVDHETPVLSVVTDNQNLYGGSGIFDNWWTDWQRPAFVEYFDSTQLLIFSQRAGMQIDGGAGGSRSHPQHSFRIEFDNGVLGEDPVNYTIIPARPDRNKYSSIYLRNGSNQYLRLPYKDACQVQTMCDETNAYHSAWRPISVYINGQYFGLYELREKFDTEYFEEHDNADPDSTSILSLSFWGGGMLRPVVGSVEDFFNDFDTFKALDETSTTYWTQADQYFDLTYYTDYIISESWMGNVDWPWNNIKLYRSNATGNRWRFCTIDLELAMAPNGWTDYSYDHINDMLTEDTNIPYIHIWHKSMGNGTYKNYFINRFADVMNTAYKTDRLISIENDMFNRTATEMQKEYQRWGTTDILGQMTGFYNDHLTFQLQLSLRSLMVRGHIETHFALPNQLDVVLDIHPAGAGKIHISTITPETYPWEGIYFNGVPVQIEAIPEPGYSFSHWGNNALMYDTLNAVWLDTLNATFVQFDAYFTGGPIGIKEENDQHLMQFFPNPANTEITLILPTSLETGETRFEIVSLDGKVSMQGVLNQQTQQKINIETLAPSAYSLIVYKNNRRLGSNKLIKIK